MYQFHRVILTKNKSPNELAFKPFEGKYANLTDFRQQIILADENRDDPGAEYVHCCLLNSETNNGKKKYLLLYEEHRLNVYDMDKDEWLLDKHDKTVSQLLWTQHDRYLLINNEIVIISAENELVFLFIGNDHICKPLVLHKYKLKTKPLNYEQHGMVCTHFKQEPVVISDGHESELSNTMVQLEIFLFGSKFSHTRFYKSLLKFGITLTYDKDKHRIGKMF